MPLMRKRFSDGGHMTNDTALTRRAFAAAAGSVLLAGCAGGTTESAEQSEEADVSQDTARDARDSGYFFDFITTLGPFDEVTGTASETPGTVESLSYTCHAYAIEATDGVEDLMVDKTLNVYLPNGYDPSRPYDVLYVLHGTGGMQDYWFGEPVSGMDDYHAEPTLNMLDTMHDQGLFGDVIIVAPTYYSIPDGYDIDATFMGSMAGGDPYADEWPVHFWKELRADIIPLVEAAYSTHAAGDVSEERLVSTRDHRGFAGLSRGSKTVMSSGMTHCADLFGYFGCYSGAWADFDAFKEALEGEFASKPIRFWYNGNGSKDFSLENHEQFVAQALEEMPGTFVDGENYAWVSFPGGEHAYNCWALDLYNTLLAFFR